MINHSASLFHICGEKVELSAGIFLLKHVSVFQHLLIKGEKIKLAPNSNLEDVSCSDRSYLYRSPQINLKCIYDGPSRE